MTTRKGRACDAQNRAVLAWGAVGVAFLAMGVSCSSPSAHSPSQHIVPVLRTDQYREVAAPRSGGQVHPSSAAAKLVLRIRGGSAAYMTAAPKVAQSQSVTTRVSDREALQTHKARLKAERPRLMNDGPSGGGQQSEKPAMLSLVNPSSRQTENHGEVKEVEKASSKSFKAFQGVGNVMLSADQIKTASSSQMHRLALARLARLQQNTASRQESEAETKVVEPTAAEDAAFQGESVRCERLRECARRDRGMQRGPVSDGLVLRGRCALVQDGN